MTTGGLARVQAAAHGELVETRLPEPAGEVYAILPRNAGRSGFSSPFSDRGVLAALFDESEHGTPSRRGSSFLNLSLRAGSCAAVEWSKVSMLRKISLA